MSRARKIVLWMVAAAAAAVIAGALLAPVFLDANRYTPQVILFFEENTGKKVEIGSLHVTLFPQVTVHIEGFGVKSPPLFPPSYIVKVAQADAVLDGWALLHRKVTVKSLVLEKPEINLVSDPDGPWNFENPQTQNEKNTFPLGVIDKVVIRDGQLTMSNLLPSDAAGPVFFEAHQIVSELDAVDLAAIANPASSALNGTGHWSASRVRFGAVQAEKVTSKFRLESRAVFFTALQAEGYEGKAAGDFSVSLAKKTPSFKADARLDGVNVAHLLAAFHETRGLLTGKLHGDMKLAGEIEHTSNPLAEMRGAGHVKITDGQAPSLALNANLMKLARFNDLGPAKENPASFSLIAADLELARQKIYSKAIDIDGYGVDVDGSGSVSLSGSDELDYQGVAAITTKQGFLTNFVARIEGAKLQDGKLSFPFHIGGTVDQPVFGKGAKK